MFRFDDVRMYALRSDRLPHGGWQYHEQPVLLLDARRPSNLRRRGRHWTTGRSSHSHQLSSVAHASCGLEEESVDWLPCTIPFAQEIQSTDPGLAVLRPPTTSGSRSRKVKSRDSFEPSPYPNFTEGTRWSDTRLLLAALTPRLQIPVVRNCNWQMKCKSGVGKSRGSRTLPSLHGVPFSWRPPHYSPRLFQYCGCWPHPSLSIQGNIEA